MNIALIVAGGLAKRFGSTIPKQFLTLNGISIIERSVITFAKHPNIQKTFCVIPNGYEDLYRSSFSQITHPEFCIGGEERYLSVKNGLNAIAKFNPTNVLVHDAARPFVNPRIITDSIEALKQYRAVDTGIKVTDTIKLRGEGVVTLKRSDLYATQTPQSFNFSFIHEAYADVKACDFTDDISLAIKLNEPVFVIDGEINNFKITTQEDLQYSEFLMRQK